MEWSRFLLKLLGPFFRETGDIQTGGIQWVLCQISKRMGQDMFTDATPSTQSDNESQTFHY
jgi:hypothetical protein